ncbi:MAG: alpha/beta hydrolase [Deltaproteobacteria bacterium]|nr:alpha/beta hydrolase [Deltaproteobacteria bacterium]
MSLRALVARAVVIAGLLATTACLRFAAGPFAGEPAAASFISVDGERIHYVDLRGRAESSTPALVLLHGFGANLDEWGLLLPLLVQRGYRVVAVDLRGHGFSDRPAAGDYSIAAQARLVSAVLDQLGVASFVPIGHSWGSAVALQLAFDAGARVPRVVFVNGLFFAAQEPLLFSWSRVHGLGEMIFALFYNERIDEKVAFALYNPEPFMTEQAVEDAVALQERPGTLAAALATVRALNLEAMEPRHFDLRQPALLLWGREDQVTPLKYGERMSLRLPHARLLVVPRCGHLPMLEAHQVVADEVLRFLEGGES